MNPIEFLGVVVWFMFFFSLLMWVENQSSGLFLDFAARLGENQSSDLIFASALSLNWFFDKSILVFFDCSQRKQILCKLDQVTGCLI